MLDKNIINEKLSILLKYLDRLEPVADQTQEQFKTTEIHYLAERYVELIVGEALDINFHIIKEKKLFAPPKYRESFVILGDAGILTSDLARRIADSAGLRNLLVHHYDEIDLDHFYLGLKPGIADYWRYAQEIFKYVETESSNE